MITLLTIIHIVAAVVLIFSVLLQSSKGSDVAGAFGGMGSQAAFGPRGTATFLSKTTVVLAVIFVVTSVSLVRLGTSTVGGGDSVLSDEPAAAAPATPAPPAGQAPATGVTVTPGATGAPVTATPPAPQVESVTPAGTPAPTAPAPAAPPAQGR
jgi:preprotein translocase subunit SecG